MYARIRVQGHLDPSWQDRFGRLHLAHEDSGTTLLSGPLPDQAALQGILLQIGRLGLALSWVEMSEESGEEAQQAEVHALQPARVEPSVGRSTSERSTPVTTIIPREQLQHGAFYHLFEGGAYGGIPLSFYWVEAAPGKGPRLHVHPYVELFVVLEGHATFTLGERAFEVEAGNVVIGPAGVPHKFINSGKGILRSIDLHCSPEAIQEWLEE